MGFKINLKPFPASEYFTVREHLRNYSGTSINAFSLIDGVAGKLKSLFHIPDGYHVQLLRTNEKDELLTNFKIAIKDDPKTGIDSVKLADQSGDGTILDLSYSFPQIPVNYSNLQSVLIDPSLSLGVPGDVTFLFSYTNLSLASGVGGDINTEGVKSLSILDHVLNDYHEKGDEVLLRESNYKAAVLNQLIDDCTFFKPQAEKRARSKTMILAETDSIFSQKINLMGYEVGTSHATNDKASLAIANYPTHSKELIEMFADRIMAL